jgi:hypothetical protein
MLKARVATAAGSYKLRVTALPVRQIPMPSDVASTTGRARRLCYARSCLLSLRRALEGWHAVAERRHLQVLAQHLLLTVELT